jgi:glutathione S-transferase
MAYLILYTNPQSRGRIVRWMLEEVGEPYEAEIIPYEQMKGERYLAVHPLGKVPALKHKDHILTECAAICAYLADVFPEAGLGPREDEKADYYRWLFFTAGPVEQALTNNRAGWHPDEQQQRMFGYGTYEKVVAALDELFSLRDYVCGDRFTAADVYVGSAVNWGTQFGTLPQRDSFTRYSERLRARPAYKRAMEIDDRALAEMQAAPPQPQPA